MKNTNKIIKTSQKRSKMVSDRFSLFSYDRGQQGPDLPTYLAWNHFVLGVLFFVWACFRRARHPPTIWTIDFSWNGLIFVVQTSRYHQNDRNFEPDPFLRSRRSKNGQNWPKTMFFNKKSIFVRSAPIRLSRPPPPRTGLPRPGWARPGHSRIGLAKGSQDFYMEQFYCKNLSRIKFLWPYV